MPKISLIIPCYNTQDFIKDCLQSILNQTFKNFEIICVNDGSTDNTLNILEDFSKNDKRFLIINQKNQGLSASRNIGFNKATGDYIIYVDGDDFLNIDFVEKLMQKSQYDMVCCSYSRVFRKKTLKTDLKIDGELDAKFFRRKMLGPLDNELSSPSTMHSLGTNWGKLYKTSIIRNNNLKFIDTKQIGTEDALFNLQYLKFCDKVFVINEPLYNYRKYNTDSLTQNRKPNLLSQWKTLFQFMKDEIGDEMELNEALRNRISLSTLGLSLNEIFSKDSIFTKSKRVKELLCDEVLNEHLKSFKINSLPIPWRIFYGFAKNKNALKLTLLTLIINRIINRYN